MAESSKFPNGTPVSVELPEFVNDAAKNLTDKPTQAIGQTITEIWQLVLGSHVSLAAEKQRLRHARALEEYKNKLEEDVSAIPEEKRIEPSLQIVGQALEDSQYCVEIAGLREMFSQLIASSMNSDYSDKIHPSFSSVIKQMSPLDAQMLRIFRDCHRSGGMAMVTYIKKKHADSYEPIMEWVPAQVPENCSVKAAIQSVLFLQRVGLVQILESRYFVNPSRYAPFQGSQLYSEFQEQAKMFGFQLDTEKHIAKLTPLGENFVSVCLG